MRIKGRTRNLKESNSLTDVQYAYWIGRGEKQILGGVSCHAYFEFKGLGLDTDKLKEAWYKIQQRHPMLRARFLENGTQQIIEQNKFSNELIIYDLREKQSEIEEHLLKIRTTNSHRIFDIEKGHVAALEVTIINNKEYQELKIKVENLMCILIEFGVHKGDKVGIYLPKGSNQIVAVLAILGIGACYVPIGVNQALQRMRGMLLKANIKTIISDENGKKYLQENVQQNIVLVNAKNAVKSSCDTMPDSTEKESVLKSRYVDELCGECT